MKFKDASEVMTFLENQIGTLRDRIGDLEELYKSAVAGFLLSDSPKTDRMESGLIAMAMMAAMTALKRELQIREDV